VLPGDKLELLAKMMTLMMPHTTAHLALPSKRTVAWLSPAQVSRRSFWVARTVAVVFAR
jgi:hypothetical protein